MSLLKVTFSRRLLHFLVSYQKSSSSLSLSPKEKSEDNQLKEMICLKTEDMTQIVKFGVVTDVQYADTDDARAWYDTTKTRYYRNSLHQVNHAFNHWNREESLLPEENRTQFVLQLGDIIDGLNIQLSQEERFKTLRRTLDQFECYSHIPTFHAVGNHELYNFKRSELAHLFQESLFKRKKFNTESMGLNALKCLIPENPNSDEMTLYYKFTPRKGVKFIALDCFDISVIGHDPTHPNYKIAEQILFEYHGHYDYDGWDLDNLLHGADKRFQASNGAISDKQLLWLEKELEESDANNELVVVFGHVGLHPESCDWNSLMWNYDKVIECFNRHPSVVTYLCGHAHNGGYTHANGVHYIVFNAIIETSPQSQSFATVTLFEDQMVIEGHGIEKSRVLPLTKRCIDTEEIDDDLLVDDNSQDTISCFQSIEVQV